MNDVSEGKIYNFIKFLSLIDSMESELSAHLKALIKSFQILSMEDSSCVVQTSELLTKKK